jgi:hypothetical protein
MKTILLSAAASLMMVGAAAAMGAGNPPPGNDAGVPSRFVVSIPTVDTGSQAYPSTQGTGSSSGLIINAPHFNPALLHHPDTGGQQMPVGLR